MEKSANEDVPRLSNDRASSDLEEQTQLDTKAPINETQSREALLIVVGGFCSLFVSFGWVNGKAIKILQNMIG